MALNLFNSINKDDLETARALLLQQSSIDPSHPFPLYNLACISALLNDLSTSVDFLKKAIEAGYSNVVHLEEDKDLDAIRNERKYKEVVDELNARKSKEMCGCVCERGARRYRWKVLQGQVDELFKRGTRDGLEKARAILFEQLEINPSHPIPLYNLACVESLLGNYLPALNFLQKSIHVGWNDLSHMKQDPDLHALRHFDDYKNLVAILEAQQQSRDSSQINSEIPISEKQKESIPLQQPVQNPSTLPLPSPIQPQQEIVDDGEVKLKILSEMGFSGREKMVFALESAGGNIDVAIGVLLNMQ